MNRDLENHHDVRKPMDLRCKQCRSLKVRCYLGMKARQRRAGQTVDVAKVVCEACAHQWWSMHFRALALAARWPL